MTTIVTALYDINRETEGDGRAFKDYLTWLPDTLSLDTNYVIYTEEKVIPYIPIKPNIEINVTTLEKVPLYSLTPKIKSIIDNSYYKKRMQDPNRVECKLPLYNVIQYSKFIWLNDAIQRNPFNSDYFFWMDAGCSRFFDGLSGIFPEKFPYKFLIQGNKNTFKIPIDDNYKWRSDCMLVGTFFGGDRQHVTTVGEKVLEKLTEMLSQNTINNEQIALAYVLNQHPELFDLYVDPNANCHLPILKYLK